MLTIHPREKKKLPKYRAKKKHYNGQIFDSRKEANFALMLDLVKVEYKTQITLVLSKAEIVYKPDFFIPCLGCYVDIKGFKTRDFALKARLFAAYVESTPLIVANVSKRSIQVFPSNQDVELQATQFFSRLYGVEFKTTKQISQDKRECTNRLKKLCRKKI